MYDSKYTDYKVTNTPYGKDVMRELVDAFRAEGIRIGLYYSLIDWHHPDFLVKDPIHPEKNNKKELAKDSSRDLKKFQKYLKNQLTEILTNYGQIDILFRITEQQKTMLEGSDRYNVAQVPTGNWRGLIFRTDVEPFNDPRVRKAMRLVADREALVQLVQGGAGNVACDSPVAPNDQYRADISCPQDIEQAKALLAEAGFADGIEVNVHVATLEPTWPTLGIAYQAQAAEAGIRVNVVQTPSDGYWNRIWMKKDVAATRWKERPADQALHEIYLSTAKWNESFYKDVDFDELLASARRELDFEKRKALYVQAQEHLFENAGTLIPYTVSMNIGSSSRVQNFDAAKEEAVRWHLVTVD